MFTASEVAELLRGTPCPSRRDENGGCIAHRVPSSPPPTAAVRHQTAGRSSKLSSGSSVSDPRSFFCVVRTRRQRVDDGVTAGEERKAYAPRLAR